MRKRTSKILAIVLSFILIFQQSLPAGRQAAFAQIAAELNITGHLIALHNSFTVDKFRPLHLRYLQYLPQENSFKLLLGRGDQFSTVGDTFRQGSNESLKRKMSPVVNLDQELQEMHKLVEAGITPSAERIKEYVASSCLKGNLATQKVVSCIADILRLEEERCYSTEATLKDILVVLE